MPNILQKILFYKLSEKPTLKRKNMFLSHFQLAQIHKIDCNFIPQFEQRANKLYFL